MDFGTIDLGDTWGADDQVIQVVTQTKGRKKNVIALLADGYTSDQLDLFEERARTAVDFLFSVEPYKSYKEYFTVYVCRTVSNESGAGVIDENDKDIIIKPVDNRFGSRWPAESYSTMLADATKIQAYLKAAIPEVVSKEVTYQDVPTALLINDTRYGGICHIYGNGWNYCQVPFQKNGGTSRWSFPKYQAVNEKVEWLDIVIFTLGGKPVLLVDFISSLLGLTCVFLAGRNSKYNFWGRRGRRHRRE